VPWREDGVALALGCAWAWKPESLWVMSLYQYDIGTSFPMVRDKPAPRNSEREYLSYHCGLW